MLSSSNTEKLWKIVRNVVTKPTLTQVVKQATLLEKLQDSGLSDYIDTLCKDLVKDLVSEETQNKNKKHQFTLTNQKDRSQFQLSADPHHLNHLYLLLYRGLSHDTRKKVWLQRNQLIFTDADALNEALILLTYLRGTREENKNESKTPPVKKQETILKLDNDEIKLDLTNPTQSALIARPDGNYVICYNQLKTETKTVNLSSASFHQALEENNNDQENNNRDVATETKAARLFRLLLWERGFDDQLTSSESLKIEKKTTEQKKTIWTITLQNELRISALKQELKNKYGIEAKVEEKQPHTLTLTASDMQRILQPKTAETASRAFCLQLLRANELIIPISASVSAFTSSQHYLSPSLTHWLSFKYAWLISIEPYFWAIMLTTVVCYALYKTIQHFIQKASNAKNTYCPSSAGTSQPQNEKEQKTPGDRPQWLTTLKETCQATLTEQHTWQLSALEGNNTQTPEQKSLLPLIRKYNQTDPKEEIQLSSPYTLNAHQFEGLLTQLNQEGQTKSQTPTPLTEEKRAQIRCFVLTGIVPTDNTKKEENTQDQELTLTFRTKKEAYHVWARLLQLQNDATYETAVIRYKKETVADNTTHQLILPSTLKKELTAPSSDSATTSKRYTMVKIGIKIFAPLTGSFLLHQLGLIHYTWALASVPHIAVVFLVGALCIGLMTYITLKVFSNSSMQRQFMNAVHEESFSLTDTCMNNFDTRKKVFGVNGQ